MHPEFKGNGITSATNLISIHLEENILWHLTAFKLYAACSEITPQGKKSFRECLKNPKLFGN